MLGYLIENNAPDEILRERIQLYSANARTPEYSSLILYEATGDEKYWLLRTAMANLENFFISAGNKPDPRTVPKENLDALKSIGRELEKRRVTDLTKEEAEEILELSAELKY